MSSVNKVCLGGVLLNPCMPKTCLYSLCAWRRTAWAYDCRLNEYFPSVLKTRHHCLLECSEEVRCHSGSYMCSVFLVKLFKKDLLFILSSEISQWCDLLWIVSLFFSSFFVLWTALPGFRCLCPSMTNFFFNFFKNYFLNSFSLP